MGLLRETEVKQWVPAVCWRGGVEGAGRGQTRGHGPGSRGAALLYLQGPPPSLLKFSKTQEIHVTFIVCEALLNMRMEATLLIFTWMQREEVQEQDTIFYLHCPHQRRQTRS